MKSKKLDFQFRDKFFYAVPSIFPKWDYPSRLAIGVNLSDFKARNAPFFNFRVKDKMYQIERSKAFRVGYKYMMQGASLPNLIPMEEFTVIQSGLKEPEKYEFDPKTNTAYPIGSRVKQEPVQLSII